MFLVGVRRHIWPVRYSWSESDYVTFSGLKWKIFKISLDTNSQIFLRLTCPLSCCLYHHHHCYHPHLLASFLYFRQHSNSCLSALAWFWTYTRSVSQRKVFDEHNCSRENVCSCEEDRLMIVYLRVWAEFLAKLFTKLRSGELKGIVRRLQSYACFLPFSWAVGAPCRSHKEIMKIQSLLLLFSATEKTIKGDLLPAKSVQYQTRTHWTYLDESKCFFSKSFNTTFWWQVAEANLGQSF